MPGEVSNPKALSQSKQAAEDKTVTSLKRDVLRSLRKHLHFYDCLLIFSWRKREKGWRCLRQEPANEMLPIRTANQSAAFQTHPKPHGKQSKCSNFWKPFPFSQNECQIYSKLELDSSKKLLAANNFVGAWPALCARAGHPFQFPKDSSHIPKHGNSNWLVTWMWESKKK